MKRLSRIWQVTLVLVLCLIGVRLALPSIVRNQLNAMLADLGEYRGSVADVDIHLWRGAYDLEGFRIEKKTGKIPTPLVAIDDIQFSVLWIPLLHLHLVGSATLINPKLNFVDHKSDEQKQFGKFSNAAASEKLASDDKPSDWQDTIKRLFPLRVDHLEIVDGALHFQNFSMTPPVDIYLANVDAYATNLTNSRDYDDQLVSNLRLSAQAMKEGKFELQASFNALERDPLFDLNAKLENLDLRELNTFFRPYANFDFNQGTASLVAELATRHRKIKGYVKPIFHAVDVASWKQDVVDDRDQPLTVIWENTVGAIMEIFRNQKKRQFATLVPIEGTLDDSNIGTFAAMMNVLKNAFVKAFNANFEGTISAKSID